MVSQWIFLVIYIWFHVDLMEMNGDSIEFKLDLQYLYGIY